MHTPHNQYTERPVIGGWRLRLHEIIYEADTPAGKLFDVLLIVAICVSILAVILESVEGVNLEWGRELRVIEWVFTILFTIEYVLRLVCVQYPLRYARSFFGIVDFLSIIPTYLALVMTGAQAFMVIRSLRLLRIFRVLKMIRFVSEAKVLFTALKESSAKIVVFIVLVIIIVLFAGTMMYALEGEHNSQFNNIPQSMWWAIVTLATVGYGDMIPQTVAGKVFAGVMITIVYSIAIPTGIAVGTGVAKAMQKSISTQACPSCSKEGHDTDAKYCKHCAAVL